MSNLVGDSNAKGGIAVSGNSTNGARGVVGVSDTNTATEGDSTSGVGVWGQSITGRGVEGHSQTDIGVHGFSEKSHGVWGESPNDIGVCGSSTNGRGVLGESKNINGIAVHGSATNGARGVVGVSDTNVGVGGGSSGQSGMAVYGEGTNGARGVVGKSDRNTAVEGDSTSGTGIWGKGSPAGHFEGNVEVTGDVILTGADCAEEFDVVEDREIEPGTVMVLDQGGKLQQCWQAYDKRVAGVVSGAGDYRPSLILDRKHPQDDRMPIALVGKVYCKVDAQYAPIEVGDLLTTSLTPGHAMKADDPHKAFGTVIGKALRGLSSGQGLVPILVALQ